MKEALKLALEALELIGMKNWSLREDKAITAIKEALAQPEQEPVAFIDMGEWPPVRFKEGTLRCDIAHLDGQKLYTTPPQCKPLRGEVLVPLNILEAAESSLGSFCSDHGWSAGDMQNMDNLSAYIAEYKAAHGIKE